ncbi:MAG: alkaline phosphatase D family protein [Planctomycetaceae bacterium]|nr:alkaline phosphatase D family protein [Planctomycetaceae bacterium]
MASFSRRLALKLLGLGAGSLGWTTTGSLTAAPVENTSGEFTSKWHLMHDRVWLGGEVWANPMENWQVKNGVAECLSTGGNRNIKLLTHQLTETDQPFTMSVTVHELEKPEVQEGVGFRIGSKADIDDYRAHAFVSSGIDIGVAGKEIYVGRTRKALSEAPRFPVRLELKGTPKGEKYELTLTVSEAGEGGQVLGKVSHDAMPVYVRGHVSVVNSFGVERRKTKGGRFGFENWEVSGPAFTVRPEQTFGPLLWTMYSLSDSRSDEGFVLKLSALTGPLGKQDRKEVELQVQENGAWKTLGTQTLDPDAWVATFRIPNWNETREVAYRTIYVEEQSDGKTVEHVWGGKIKANPKDRPLRLGALTCQNDYAFPYAPVADNLVRLDPDMLYFSGDQLYENHGGFGIIRDPAEPAILNYLRKFYQHGWAFREAMKDRPTLCIPDDHDVFQGNIWGEGGLAMPPGSESSTGGYREPARMVNVVHKTNAGHHPDYYDPTPVAQNISVYYGDMVYGGVSFAVLGDRQWKSGPDRVETGSGRADHVMDPDFDTSVLDKPGLVLLGERQEKFLKAWSEDWRGHSIKVLLSQTVFAGVATHHGGYNGYLKADLDSGGWPQTPRNHAIDILRPSMALHINGDQHLTSLCQYGVHQQRDSNWSFCTPAIAAGYPRWWRPDEIGMPHKNRPEHGLPDTGEYLDGLGNKVYVYAVGNPEVASKKGRYEVAHQKGSGFGLVVIDPKAKTYEINSFRFLIDATEENAENQFPGWPVTLQQAENRGENQLH